MLICRLPAMSSVTLHPTAAVREKMCAATRVRLTDGYAPTMDTSEITLPHLLQPTPISTAAALATLVDVLMPGDDLFPAASSVGTQGHLANRLRERAGSEGLSLLLETLGPDFAGAPFADRERTVRRLEDGHPALFALVRMAAYTAYYAAPAVIDAIRALGHEYNDAPQPRGYEMRRFDPTPGADLPAEPRGSYLTTDEVARVDTSALADLGLPAVWPRRPS